MVSPLKEPIAVWKRLRASYVKSKRKEIHDAVVTEFNSNIRAAYNVPGTSTMPHESCNDRDSWKDNIRHAYVKCTSCQEQCPLLTLLPPAVTAKEVLRVIPKANRLIIQKAKNSDSQGVWSTVKAYSRHRVGEQDIPTVLSCYITDELYG